MPEQRPQVAASVHYAEDTHIRAVDIVNDDMIASRKTSCARTKIAVTGAAGAGVAGEREKAAGDRVHMTASLLHILRQRGHGTGVMTMPSPRAMDDISIFGLTNWRVRRDFDQAVNISEIYCIIVNIRMAKDCFIRSRAKQVTPDEPLSSTLSIR